MPRRAGSLATSMLCLAICLSGCARPVPEPLTVAVRQEYTRCPRPEQPILPTLDRSRHLADPDNVAALLEAVDGLAGYAARLSAALDCYEPQAGANIEAAR